MVEEELFSKIIDTLLEGTVILNSDKKILFWNKWIEQASGIEKSQALGKPFLSVFPDIEYTRIDSSIDLALEKGQSSFIAHIMNPIMLPLHYESPGSGEKARIFHNIRVTSLVSGSNKRVLMHITDETSNVRKESLLKAKAAEEKVLSNQLKVEIEERKVAESKLRLSAAVIQNTTEGIVITDQNAIVLEINPAFTEIMGYTRSDMIGNHVRIVKSGKHSDEFYRNLWQNLSKAGRWKGEFINKKPDNSLIVVESSITEIRNDAGEISHYVNIFHDVTNRKKHEEMLEKWSWTDPLTELGNRRYFDENIEKQWRICMRHGFMIGVIMLDVDYFKRYNDRYGHTRGDECLVKISNVLKVNLRRGDDKIVRYGGEEFIIIMTQIHEEGLTRVTEAILRDVVSLKIPHEDSDVSPFVTVSAGLSCVVPGNDNSWSELIEAADGALYEAKKSGRNRFSVKKPGN